MALLSHNVVPSEALAVTLDFRVRGLVHVRRGMAMSRFLNQRERSYVPMTDCRVYRHGLENPPAEEALLYETGFVALPKDRLAFLVGGMAEPPTERQNREPRQVTVLYPRFVLNGTMYMPARVRMSDHLSHVYAEKPFVEMSEVSMSRQRDGVRVEDLDVVTRLPLVTVNVALAGALFDATARR